MIRQSNNYSCGAAVLNSILIYYLRDEPDYDCLTEQDLQLELKTSSIYGTNYEEIIKEAEKRNLKCEVFDNKSNIDPISKVKSAVDKGRLAICNIQAWSDDQCVDYKNIWDSGHYAVAVGYDEKNIYFMDPWVYGNYAYLPVKDLIERWHDLNSDKNSEKFYSLGIILWRDSVPEYHPDIISKIQ